ncbi:MAG: nucleotidyltransferase family protein [Candidatus Bipolaricaulota bacterium]|nr:nucleotidyltransferase family protein [Candidatus Bipolaricaulota bacterium]MDW8126701.1 nucleotidyltransferase family protein [Candidatus Bipolaricaulota bacterium]
MPEVAGVVLAAGPGKRMGLPSPKLLLPIRGKPILAWVLDLVERLPLTERIIVVGAYASQIISALFSPAALNSWNFSTPPFSPQERAIPSCAPCLSPEEKIMFHGEKNWRVLYNPNWPEGMGSSLRRAAEAVTTGMLVFLGDMPFVPESAARAVLGRAGEKPVAPSYQGQRGFPVYLPPSFRAQLLRLRGDKGARDLLKECELVPSADPGVIWDVDQPEDLQAERWCECGQSP